jgi:hypothetical protein
LLRERLDPVAVGVFGDWGSGKSTVLEILREKLLPRGRVAVVYTRPWEHDPNIDPKATLIAEVLNAVRSELAKDESRMAKLAGRFKELASRVQWSKAITMVPNSALTFSIPQISEIVGLFGTEDDEPRIQRCRASATNSTNSWASWTRSTVSSCSWMTLTAVCQTPLWLRWRQ